MSGAGLWSEGPDPASVQTTPKNLTVALLGQSGRGIVGTGVGQRVRRRSRGGGWQVGQKYDERFMNATRRMGVAQRAQGSPSWP